MIRGINKMFIDREKAVKVFNEYVQKYDSDDGRIKLKIDHTFRVSNLCEKIAISLGLNQSDIDIAWLSGLLHDIGRFEQAKRFGTFNDLKSINHAKLGCEILFNEGKIRDFIDDKSEDMLIEDVIKNHNAYKISDNLSERSRMFSNILRDADKIDILKVNLLSPVEEIYNVTMEEVLNTEISKDVMDNFKEEDTILRNLKKTAVDNIVGHISLVFGLVYPESINIAKEQGDIYKLLKFKSLNEKTNIQFKEIIEIILKYLDKVTI